MHHIELLGRLEVGEEPDEVLVFGLARRVVRIDNERPGEGLACCCEFLIHKVENTRYHTALHIGIFGDVRGHDGIVFKASPCNRSHHVELRTVQGGEVGGRCLGKGMNDTALPQRRRQRKRRR